MEKLYKLIINIPYESFTIHKRSKQRKHIPFIFSDNELKPYEIKLKNKVSRTIFTDNSYIELINSLKNCVERRYNYAKLLYEINYICIAKYETIIEIDVYNKKEYIKYNIEDLYKENKDDNMYNRIILVANENFHLSWELKNMHLNNIYIIAKNHHNKWSIMGGVVQKLMLNDNIDIQLLTNKNIVKETLNYYIENNNLTNKIYND